jgi:uroporphyrinogen-III synthase
VAIVVLTREPPRNDELRLQLDASAEVYEVPLTRTLFRSAGDVQRDLAACENDGAFVILAVTSARSASYVRLALSHCLDGAPVAVVGAATAAATRELLGESCHIDVAPDASALALARTLDRGPVLSIGAREARRELADDLQRRGITCESVPCYETQAVELTDQQRDLVSKADVIVVAAPSAWAQIDNVVSTSTRVVTIGPTTFDAVATTHERVVDGTLLLAMTVNAALIATEGRGGP